MDCNTTFNLKLELGVEGGINFNNKTMLLTCSDLFWDQLELDGNC